MDKLFGFFLVLILPAVCSYGIYLDFESISAAVLAFVHVFSTGIMLGHQYNVLKTMADFLRLKK